MASVAVEAYERYRKVETDVRRTSMRMSKKSPTEKMNRLQRRHAAFNAVQAARRFATRFDSSCARVDKELAAASAILDAPTPSAQKTKARADTYFAEAERLGAEKRVAAELERLDSQKKTIAEPPQAEKELEQMEERIQNTLRKAPATAPTPTPLKRPALIPTGKRNATEIKWFGTIKQPVPEPGLIRKEDDGLPAIKDDGLPVCPRKERPQARQLPSIRKSTKRRSRRDQPCVSFRLVAEDLKELEHLQEWYTAYHDAHPDVVADYGLEDYDDREDFESPAHLSLPAVIEEEEDEDDDDDRSRSPSYDFQDEAEAAALAALRCAGVKCKLTTHSATGAFSKTSHEWYCVECWLRFARESPTTWETHYGPQTEPPQRLPRVESLQDDDDDDGDHHLV